MYLVKNSKKRVETLKFRIRKQKFYIFFLMFFIFFLRIFIISPVSVSGISMEPTLYSGETGIVFKKGSIERNDIICFIGEKESGDIFIKRVIGLAGDSIKINENEIFVNRIQLEEPYLIKYPLNSNFNLANIEFTVPKGKIFVLGDNRIVSLDSREIGYVSEEEVIGKLIISFGIRNN